MGRNINDGRGRLGGRAKGTPNKPQPSFTVWADALVTKMRPAVEHLFSQTPYGKGAEAVAAALIIATSIDRLTAAINGTSEPVEGNPATETPNTAEL